MNRNRAGLATLIALIGFNVGTVKGLGQENGGPPALPNIFVTWPVFKIKGQEPLSAGKAFVVRLDNGRQLLVSCLHLFGPLGGLAKHILPKDLPAKVMGVSLLSLDGTTPVGNAGHELLSSGTPIDTADANDYRGDLVAFAVPDKSPLGSVEVIATTPEKGTRVWLATTFAGDSKPTANLYAGTVTGANGKYTEVTMDNPIVLQACSGAPVLNSKGQLVGMLLGGTSARPDKIYLNPGESIRSRLMHEL